MSIVELDHADIEVILESLTLWEKHLKTSLLMRCLHGIAMANDRLAAHHSVELYEEDMEKTAWDQSYHLQRAAFLKAKLLEAKK